MHYVMVIYETPDQFGAREGRDGEPYLAAWRAYYNALVEAGAYIAGGAPLKAPATGTTVRVNGSERRVQDGPFAETKDQLGGFMVLNLASLDEALEWAARCPVAASGAVEVRPMDTGWHEAVITS